MPRIRKSPTAVFLNELVGLHLQQQQQQQLPCLASPRLGCWARSLWTSGCCFYKLSPSNDLASAPRKQCSTYGLPSNSVPSCVLYLTTSIFSSKASALSSTSTCSSSIIISGGTKYQPYSHLTSRFLTIPDLLTAQIGLFSSLWSRPSLAGPVSFKTQGSAPPLWALADLVNGSSCIFFREAPCLLVDCTVPRPPS